MKAALIGYGYWGKIIEKYICDSTYFDLAAVCSPELDNNGIYTKDLEKLMYDPQLEAVFICTPVSTHFDICKKFLESGKHIFCEKPTVKTLEQFQILKNLAVKTHRILYTDYIYTVSPSIQKMKSLLKKIGNIQVISGEIRQFGRFYEEDDVFEVLGIHLLSVAAFFLNSISVHTIQYDPWDKASPCLSGRIEIRFDNGTIADLACSSIYPDKIRRIVVQGTKGILIFDMYGKQTLRYFPYSRQAHFCVPEQEESWQFDEGNNLQRAIKQFGALCDGEIDPTNLVLSECVIKLLDRRKEFVI